MEITKDTIIENILRDHPECCAVFERHNLPCSECMGASIETLADLAILHNVDLDKLIVELTTCVAECG